MVEGTPTAELDPRYSDESAAPTEWVQVRDQLARAEVFWLSTVRPDGRPHVTPLIAVWVDDTLVFCTGPDERKARNLAQNRHVVLTTGRNGLWDGMDLVVEGEAQLVQDDGRLRRIAEAYESKYGSDWHFDVQDGMLHHGPGHAIVYAVSPSKVLAFGKGGSYSQTRYRFARR